MDSCKAEEMMRGGSDEEQYPQVALLLSMPHVTVTISQEVQGIEILVNLLLTEHEVDINFMLCRMRHAPL